MHDLKDKVCIITGAASGIGRAIADLLIKSGGIVIAIDKDPALLHEKIGSGARKELKLCDVRDAAHLKSIVEEVVKKYGKIDYLFNNAGIVVIGEERDITLEDWKEVVDTDLCGVINGVTAAYPVMVRQGFGHIVNTSSLAGLISVTIESSYVASKYAVVGLSHALRMEGEGLGVKVSVVCPGPVRTPIMFTSKVVGSKAKTPADFLKLLPWLPKIIAPEKAAAIILSGVLRNKATILTDIPSRLFWYLYRLSPDLWMWFYNAYTIDRIRNFRAEGGEEEPL